MTKTMIAAGCALAGAAVLGAESPDPLRARAHELHRRILVLDTHADMTPLFERDSKVPEITDPGLSGPGYDPSKDPGKVPVIEPWMKEFPEAWSFGERHERGILDLPRMREGGLNAEFVSIFMDREDRPGMAIKRSLDYIESVHALVRKYPRDIALATTAQEVRSNLKSGRISFLIGMEGGHMIEDDLRVLRMYQKLGVRYLTLTHCFNTNWADSSGCGTPVKAEHNGLSPFGKEVVKELNRLGIMVDITHTADKTFYDAIAVSQAPVIASHSSVDAIKEHARNLSDDMLRALAKNGGVVQINCVVKYIDPVAGRETPISVFIDHVAHAIEVAGPDHVGIGLDLSYSAPEPAGLKNVKDMENITYELLKRGFDETTVRKVWGENTLRVMVEVERVASRLQAAP